MLLYKQEVVLLREPVYCGADHSCLWELCSALHHYHPVVHSVGTSLLSTQAAASRGDPLQELTLFAFLEKFVNRKDSRMKTAVDHRTLLTPGTSLYQQCHGSSAFDSLAAKDVSVVCCLLSATSTEAFLGGCLLPPVLQSSKCQEGT